MQKESPEKQIVLPVSFEDRVKLIKKLGKTKMRVI